MSKDTFGINMKHYCRAHEKTVTDAISEGRVTPELLTLHKEKIAILQHERLVHLIVTLMVVIAALFTADLILLHPAAAGVVGAAVMLGLAVLLGFYFYHYFFLENTVQHWYKLADMMQERRTR